MSKSFKNLFLLTTLFAGAASQAGRLEIRPGDSRNLPDCGGHVSVHLNDNDQPVLNFRGVQDCSNFDIVGANGEAVDYENKKLGGPDRARSGSFTLPKRLIDHGRNAIYVVVKSNSGRTRDHLTIKFRTDSSGGNPSPNLTMTLGQTRHLPSCEGTVKVTKSQNDQGDQVNVVFSNVQNCSKFDILGANGQSVSYPQKNLQKNSGGYAGSFTIPSRYIDWLGNSIIVVVRSNSGRTDDIIRVKFFSW